MRGERNCTNVPSGTTKRIVRRKRGDTEDKLNNNKCLQNQEPTSKISKVDYSNNNYLKRCSPTNQVYCSKLKQGRNNQAQAEEEGKKRVQNERKSPVNRGLLNGATMPSIPKVKPVASAEGRPTSVSPSSLSRTAMSASPATIAAYAGAKFSEPPSPTVLPKPPVHWFSFEEVPKPPHSCSQITVALKGLLNVQA